MGQDRECYPQRSLPFLAVVSKRSVGKQGVKDEWALGLTLEKSTTGFVIPIRIEPTIISLLPIGFQRKNVIDFCEGWHTGLAGLLDTLSDANTPRSHRRDPRAVSHWLFETTDRAVVRTDQVESLDSTWLRIPLHAACAGNGAFFPGNEREIRAAGRCSNSCSRCRFRK